MISFAREAIWSVNYRFPRLQGPPKMDHFGTLGTTKHTLFHPTASGHPICTPGRPKRSIVSTWAPKTLPKWSPKRCQVDKCRPSRNMCRRERIACLPPLGELRFRSFFRVRKMPLKLGEKRSISQNMHQHVPQSAPPGTRKGGPNPSKIMKKSSLSRPGCLQVTFGGS